ncbi:MAG: hypothetical protein ABID45_01675, partial [Patescibacteria group bacterium]
MKFKLFFQFMPILLVGFFISGCGDSINIDNDEGEDRDLRLQNMNENVNENINRKIEIKIPSSINLDIPFQPQAPFANWDMPYQEGCEEASIILAVKYLEGIDYISADEMDNEILNMVDYQNINYGGHHDLSA